jgi:hypothetical protein
MGMAYDVSHSNIVMFGGSQDIAGTQRLNDTWIYDATGWHPQTAITQWPCTRHSTRMAWDGTRVILFGGNGGADCQNGPINLADTWFWTGTDWSPCTLCSGPSKREGEALAFDSLHTQVVLFGGTGTCPTDATKCSDTWVWTGASQTWTQCDPLTSCATHPSARGAPAMEFHAERHAMILFGGKEPNNVVDDTWSWNGTTWSDITSQLTDPSPRTGARMAYDAAHHPLVLYGGCTGGCGTLESHVTTVVKETYTLDGGDWTVWNNAAPPARCCVGMAYFASGPNTIYLFGGASDTTVFGDLWKWNFNNKKWVCLQSCPNP